MAGRGRGGGGGGRGRGRGMTFDPRDLGFAPGEQLPGPVLQPPPLYPTLDYRPASLQSVPEVEYMVAVKKDLVVFLKDHLPHWDEQGGKNKSWQNHFDWRRMPTELQSRQKSLRGKKRAAGTAPAQHKKVAFDLNSLDALAKLEEKNEESEGEKEGEAADKEPDQEDAEDDEMEEDMDEEMDDGTDYVNNYFDNGEGNFDDDDDNGNDGPIY